MINENYNNKSFKKEGTDFQLINSDKSDDKIKAFDAQFEEIFYNLKKK